MLRGLAGQSSGARVHDLGTTPGGRDLVLLEIKGAGSGTRPAVLVVANPLGTTPLATEAALTLAQMLVRGEAAGRAAELTWYIVAAANPDGAARFFASPRVSDGRNDKPFDDDKDGEVDEDGPDDLNGDGFISTMLYPDPEGSWMLTDGDPALPRKAEAVKGEKGTYLRLVEGRDDDGDGSFNEDGPGGANPGKNFPHAFEHWTKDAGLWPASEAETRGLLRFAFDHPEIAMILVLGEANNLASVPESDKQSEAQGGTYKLPEWLAEEAGLDPEAEFTLDELVEMARDFTGMQSITAEDVLTFLELGAAVNPSRDDLLWWNELSELYREFLEDAGLGEPRVAAAETVPGSVEEWAYYQFGVPSFALDFWSVPKPASEGEDEAHQDSLTPDQVEVMGRDEFIALGEERIQAFLKANEAPAHITPAMVIGGLQSGMFSPAKIAEMMRDNAEKKDAGGADPNLLALAAYEHGGYRPWQDVTLPGGRVAKVGGADPFALRTPPSDQTGALISAQLPFFWKLADWLPSLAIGSVEVEARGRDVYAVKAQVENLGRIPYPTAQGKGTSGCLRWWSS